MTTHYSLLALPPFSPTPPPPQPDPAPPSPQAGPSAPTTDPKVTFVNGKGGKPNAIVDGHRYCREKIRGRKTYWKCTLHTLGCKGRLVLLDETTVTNQPVHTGHEGQNVEINIHSAKHILVS